MKKITTFSVVKLKKSIFLTLKIALIFTLIFVVFKQQFNLKGIAYIFMISCLYSFGLGFGNALINDFLNKKWSWIAETNQRVWAGVVTTVVYTIIAVLVINYIQFIVLQGLKVESFFTGFLLYVHIFTVIISLGVATFFQARGFMINWKASVSQETTRQEIVAKTETAKFESLKNQLDPHFLFNSLNVLTSLIGENPNQAEKFTTKLSKVYRYVLEQRNKDLVPIEEELKFAKAYMQL